MLLLLMWLCVEVGVQMMREIYHLIRGSQMTPGFTLQAFQAGIPFRKWLTLTKRNCRITAPFFALLLAMAHWGKYLDFKTFY